MNWKYIALIATGAGALWWRRAKTTAATKITVNNISTDSKNLTKITYTLAGKTLCAYKDKEKWYDFRSDASVDPDVGAQLSNALTEATNKLHVKAKVLAINGPSQS